MSAPKNNHRVTAASAVVVVLGLLLSLAFTSVASAMLSYDGGLSRSHSKARLQAKAKAKHKRAHRRRAHSAAGSVSYDLCAVAGTTTPAGAPGSVPVWSFALKPGGGCAAAVASLPAPTLTADEGDAVTLTVENKLPDALSFDIPGVTFNNGLTSVAPGAVRTITFTATNAGSFLYESSGDAGRQAEVGLAGPLVVGSSMPLRAYDDASTTYNVSALMVLSDVDPNLNATLPGGTLAAFDMATWAPAYRLINGLAYPDTATPATRNISAAAGQKVLLRYVNTSSEHISMTVLGADATVVGRDGGFLTSPLGVTADTIPAGGTADEIVTVPATAHTGDKIAIYERNLRLQNGSTAGLGGRVRFIVVS